MSKKEKIKKLQTAYATMNRILGPDKGRQAKQDILDEIQRIKLS